MSLLLSGAKTITVAGTVIQCIEVYKDEAYTIGLNFTDSASSPVDITNWGFATTAAYYSVDTVAYAGNEITLGNITLDAGSPTPPTGLTTAGIVPLTNGQAYLYLPTELADGLGGRPAPALLSGKGDPTVLVIVTIKITRASASAPGEDDISREPIGIICRYQ